LPLLELFLELFQPLLFHSPLHSLLTPTKNSGHQ
jgi:hypothetical protein